MRHGYRTTVLDLFPEQRNHRTVTAQHITETGCHKLSHPFHLAVLDGLVQTLHINFADTLATSHHVRRVHGLVRAYHHEFLRSVLHSQVRHHARTIYIILYRLARVVLHHRHMLVGRCMEHIFRPILLINLFHPAGIANACHQGMCQDVGVILRHIQTHIVHRCLRLVYQHQLLRMVNGYLSHHLATDASGCSRYQDTLVREHGTHLFHINLNLLTRKQVFDIHFLQHLIVQVRLSVPFNGLLHHVDMDIFFYQTVYQFHIVTELLAIQRRNQQHRSPAHLHLVHQRHIVLYHSHPHQTLVHILRIFAHKAR